MNENLEKRYNDLYQKNYSIIANSNYSIDEQIDDAGDQRFGLTLLIRPSETVKANIDNVLNRIKEIEPEQYYYPKSDLHITVLSIISCYSGFELSRIATEQYATIIRKSLEKIDNFEITFKGITLSDAGVLIKGYPSNDSFNNLRENLRENFSQTHLEQSIDSRYILTTAHITAIRFRKKLNDPKAFLTFLEQFKEHDFGKSKIDNLELVYNDWYQKEEKVQRLDQFKI